MRYHSCGFHEAQNTMNKKYLLVLLLPILAALAGCGGRYHRSEGTAESARPVVVHNVA